MLLEKLEQIINLALSEEQINEHALKSKSGQQLQYDRTKTLEDLANDYFNLIKNHKLHKVKNPMRKQSNNLFPITYYNPFTQKQEENEFSFILGSHKTGMLHIYERHYSDKIAHAIGEVEKATNKTTNGNKPLIEEENGKIQTNRLLYFYNGYLYIVGIPDIHSNGDLNDQLCYLHNIYPWTKNQYDDLKQNKILY